MMSYKSVDITIRELENGFTVNFTGEDEYSDNAVKKFICNTPNEVRELFDNIMNDKF